MAREEFRRRIQIPMPSIPEIEARLHQGLSPEFMAPARLSNYAKGIRNRVLPLANSA